MQKQEKWLKALHFPKMSDKLSTYFTKRRESEMAPEEYSNHILTTVNTTHQFAFENGITVTDVVPGRARGVLKVGVNSINPHGNVHGGALAALADTVGGCCACSKGGSCVTSGSTMEFLRPATGNYIYCEATPKKMGRKLSVIQVVLTNESQAVVATGTFTFFMSEGV
jgi:acyl-CoA thioesterase